MSSLSAKGLLLCALLLSACTIAVHDPVAFEKRAKHVEMTYQVPMGVLFDCMMQSRQVPNWEYYTTKDTAYYGLKGVLRIRFTAVSDTETRVHAAGLTGGDPFTNPDLYIGLLNGCAADLEKKSPP